MKKSSSSLRNNKFILLLCILLASSFVASSKTVYSIAPSTDWNKRTDWSNSSGGLSCSCTPDESSSDIIYVENNTISSTGITFGGGVTLIVRNNVTLTINGNVRFNRGSDITVETGSILIVDGNILNRENSDQITINGSLVVSGNYLGEDDSKLIGTGSLRTTGSAITQGNATVFGSKNNCPGNCYGSAVSPLPVEFLYFNLVANENDVQVIWSTASEFNSDYFVVQRSQNGSDFVDIIKLAASGNSSAIKNYIVSDNEPAIGVAYYRIKQIDFNGDFKFSNTLSVNFKNDETMAVFPSPCLKDQPLSIRVLGKSGEELQLVITDLQGAKIYSSANLVSSDKEVISIDLPGKIASGVYFLVTTSRNAVYRKKVVIK